MGRKRRKPPGAARASVHATFDAELARRLRAFAGYHARDISDVLAEGARLVIRGFSARQEGPRAGTCPAEPPPSADARDAA